MKQWYQVLFKNYSRKYDREPYTKGTLGECNFIEREISFDKNKRILDIGCGTGRHAIELAGRGYDVTGIDLSVSQIERAKMKAKERNLFVVLELMDARDLAFSAEFDLVIMLCEGAFPLMETDEMNYSILQNASRSLKSKGKIILTTLNALYPLFHSLQDALEQYENESYSSVNFDLMTFRERSIMDITDDDGNKKRLVCDERYYTPPEMKLMLNQVGFHKVDIYAAHLGNFSRSHKLQTDDFEMLVVGCKP